MNCSAEKIQGCHNHFTSVIDCLVVNFQRQRVIVKTYFVSSKKLKFFISSTLMIGLLDILCGKTSWYIAESVLEFSIYLDCAIETWLIRYDS